MSHGRRRGRGEEPRRYQRGTEEFQRVLGFTDAVVAIAMTLLVLNVDLPRPDGDGADVFSIVGGLSGQIAAFVLSFVIIGWSWMRHHRFLGSLAAIDAWLILQNFVYLLAIVFVPLQAELIGFYGDSSEATFLYAGWWAVLFATDPLGYGVAVWRRLFFQAPSRRTVVHALVAKTIPVVTFSAVAVAALGLGSNALWFLFLNWPAEALWDRLYPPDPGEATLPGPPAPAAEG